MYLILINLHNNLREQLTIRWLMNRDVVCNLLQLFISFFTICVMPKMFECMTILGGEKHQTQFFFLTLAIMVVIQCSGFILPEEYKNNVRFRDRIDSFFRRFI
jgi:hypothetical protein